jgi:hypothetical protein
MAKLPDLFVNAVSTWDGKALAKGQKQIGGFEKGVKNLAKAFGVTFGAAALAQFGKASVKAFAEDEAATVRLTQAVNNLGLGFEDLRIKQFISDLEASAHVADDILRPAFQALLSTTGSVARSQSILNTALEVSAGTGIDAAEVAKDLGLAFLGQTKGLAKYNTGLSKAELAATDFNTIQTKLNQQYAGSNAARLDTYAGKVAAVQIAYGNLQETVGGALIEAFMKLSGDTTVDDLTESVDNLADAMADVIKLGGAFASPFVKVAKLFTDASDAYVKGLYKITGAAYFGKVSDRQYGGAAAEKYKAIQEKANAKARAAAEAAAAKREKERLAILKRQELAEKNKAALSKAQAEFDTNRISIAAALKATYDKETRLRLEALMAIEDEDGDKALDRLNKLGILTEANQTAKLNGLKGITETELAGLNAVLMKELSAIEAAKNAKLAAINASGADQASKDAAKLAAIAAAEAAEAAAFAKYNDALSKQGGLNDLDFYTKKTQITTLEVLRLASINKTTAAQTLADQLALAAGIKTVEEIAAKRKAAQDADNAAMAAEAAARKAAEDKAFTDYLAALKTKNDAALAADADLTAAKLASISSVAAAQAAADAAALSGVAALSAAIKSIPPYPTWTPPPAGSMPELPSMRDPEGNFPDFGGGLYIDPSLVNPGGGGNNYTVTVNAGAIASQDEFTALLQDTIQRLNRNGDPLTTAGIA